MDTTSHNFTWQTWTFGGQAGSCTLYDVAIIDENNIWAVGEIYIADTSQNGYTLYNAVHWDGNQWELKRIKTNACGGVVYPPIKAIFAFSSDDILFAHIDGSITYYDGINFTNDCSLITQLNGSANKIWGVSRNDYYVVSGNGFIAHYQNGQWSRIESGTDLDFHDIYGATDSKTGEQQILAVASDGWNEKILQVKNAVITILQDYGLSKDLHSVWFEPERRYYIVGAGIFQKHSLKDSIWTVYPPGVVTNYYSGSIDGNGINDVFVTGAFFEVVHFNGANWFSYRNVFPLENGTFGRVAIKSNLVVMAGFKNQQAIIAMGLR
jgi:hypothetical protein